MLTANRDAPGHFRSYQVLHQRRGWPDIAYHYLIDRGGNVYQGRPVLAVGDTATPYDPTGHFLVMCDGNFQEQEPSEEQVATLIRLLAWAASHFGASPATIRGHRDYTPTACPGDALYRLIQTRELQRRVQQLVARESVRMTVVCGRRARRMVTAIEAGRRS